MSNGKRKRNLLLALIAFVLVAISVAYASMSAKLSINGNAGISSNSWNVYFNDVNERCYSMAADTPAYIVENDKTKINFTISLNTPGQVYSFDAEIKNGGSIDAMIDEVTLTGLPDDLKDIVEWKAEYLYGDQLQKCDELLNNSSRKIRLTVEYKKDIETLPEEQELNLSLVIKYIQLDGNSCTLIPAEEDPAIDSQCESHTLTINPNGGVYNDSTESTIMLLTPYDTYTVLLPTYEDHEFEGWTVSASGVYDEETNIVTMGTENVTLTASWSEISRKHNIIIDPNGGTYNGEEEDTIVEVIEGLTYTVAAPARDGYEFTGWTVSDDDAYNSETSVVTMGTSDITLTANWEEIEKFTLTIDPSDGTYNGQNGVFTKKLMAGEEYTVLVPESDYFTFDGWTVSDSSTYNVDTRVFTMGEQDVIMTAKWIDTNAPEDSVARINRVYYPTIQEAFDDAEEADVVHMLKSTTESPTNNTSDAITLNLEGFTVTGTMTNKGNLTLLNGSLISLDGTGFVNDGILTMGVNDRNVLIDDYVNIEGSKKALEQNGTFNFYDGYLESVNALDGKCNDLPENYFVYYDRNEEKQKVYPYFIADRAIAKTIDGSIETLYYNLQDAFDESMKYDLDIIVIRDFISSYDLNVYENKNVVLDLNEQKLTLGHGIVVDGEISISNGEIVNSDTITINGTINANNVVIKTNENSVFNNYGSVNFVKTNYNSTVTNYSSISFNVDSYSKIDTFINTEDTTGTILNGKYDKIINNGNLTIENAKMDYKSRARYALIENTGDITINGGSYNLDMLDSQDYQNAFVVEGGNITVNGGELKAGAKYYTSTLYGDTVVINGGTIIAKPKYYAPTTIEAKNVIVNGGTIIATTEEEGTRDNICAINAVSVVINDGTIQAIAKGSYSEVAAVKAGVATGGDSVIMNGGTIESTEYCLFSNYNVIMNDGTLSCGGFGVFADFVDVFDGTINSSKASIYMKPDYRDSILNITGGNITSSEEAALSLILGDHSSITVNISAPETATVSDYPTLTGGTNGIDCDRCTLNINRAIISGNEYGIDLNGTLNLGVNDSTVGSEYPYIIGETYGVYERTGSVTNFYDGVLYGQTAAINEGQLSIPDSYYVKKQDAEIDDNVYEKASLARQMNIARVGEVEYNSLSKAVNAIASTGDIVIIEDFILSSIVQIPEGKNITIDVNGHEIIFNDKIENNGTLTIEDNDNEKTAIFNGKINQYLANHGTLYLNGVKYSGNNGVLYSNGTVTITGSNFELLNIETNNPIIYADTNSSLTLIDSTIRKDAKYDLETGSSSVSNKAVYANGATVNISNTNITLNKGYAFCIDGTGIITMNGGSCNVEATITYGIVADGITLTDVAVIINPLSIYAATGIQATNNYNPRTCNITGGTINISGNGSNAVYCNIENVVDSEIILDAKDGYGVIFYGHPTITSGTFRLLNTTSDRSYIIGTDGIVNGGTFVSSSNCINSNGGTSITGGNFTCGGNGFVNYSGEANITGGSFVTGGYSLYAKAGTVNIGTEDGNVSMESPSFISETVALKNDNAIVNFYDGVLKGQTSAYSGIIYNTANTYAVKNSVETIDGKEYKVAKLGELGNFLKVGDSYYSSMNDAVDAITSTGTIEVLASAPINIDFEIPEGKTITVDLNENTLRFSGPLTNKGSLTITDGGDNGGIYSISNEVFINNGTLVIDSGNYQSKYRIVSNGISSQLTINDGNYVIKESTNSSAALVSNSGTVVVNGGTFESSYYGFSGGTITVDNVEITSVKNSFNDFGNLTISDSSVESGDVCLKGYFYTSAVATVSNSQFVCATNGVAHVPNVRFTNVDMIAEKTVLSTGLIEGSYVRGGRLKSNTAIAIDASYSTVLDIGSNDGNLDQVPEIIGGTYAVRIGYEDSVNVNFYDGILKGKTNATFGSFNGIANNANYQYGVETVDEDEYETLKLIPLDIIARNSVTDVTYTNISDALNDAHDDEQIILLKDAQFVYETTIDENVNTTINLNGHDLMVFRKLFNNGVLNITDEVRDTRSKFIYYGDDFGITNNNVLNITNADVQMFGGVHGYPFENHGSLNITNSTMSFKYSCIIMNYDDGIVNLSNVQVDDENYLYSYGVMNIDDSIVGPIVYLESSSGVINNSTLLSIECNGSLIINNSVIRSGISNYGNISFNESEIIGNIYNSGGTMNLDKISMNRVTTTKENVTMIRVYDGTLNISNSNISYKKDLEANVTNTTYKVYVISYYNGVVNSTNNTYSMEYTNGINRDSTYLFYGEDGTGSVNSTGDVVEKMGGYTTSVYFLKSSGDSTLTGVTINDGENFSDTKFMVNVPKGKLTIDDCTFNATGTGNTFFLIRNSGGNIDLKNSTLNATYGSALYNYAGNTSIDNVDMNVSGYGISSKSGIIDFKTGNIVAGNYGIYVDGGTINIGEEDGSGEADADVSLDNPYIYGRNYGIRKYSGAVNYYDGMIESSSYTSYGGFNNTENNFEPVEYYDQENNNYYTILKHTETSADTAVVKSGTTLYTSLLLAIKRDVYNVTLLKNIEEDIELNRSLTIDLNGLTISGKITNNSSLTVYNGSIINEDGPAIVNNGTLSIGVSDSEYLVDNVVISGSTVGVDGEGIINMYDGTIRGIDKATNSQFARIENGYTTNEIVQMVGAQPYKAISLTNITDWIQVGENGYSSFIDAYNAIDEEGTIKLTGDGRIDGTIYSGQSPYKKITIDLNGHTLTFNSTFYNYGELNIIDSSDEKTGKTFGTTSNYLYNYGKMVINDVTLAGTNDILYDYGNYNSVPTDLSVSNTKLICTNSCSYVMYIYGKVDLDNVEITINNTGYGIYNYYSGTEEKFSTFNDIKVNILGRNGSTSSSYGIYSSYPITVTGYEANISGKMYGYGIYSPRLVISDFNININTEEGSNSSYGISASGLDAQNGTIIVKGGKSYNYGINNYSNQLSLKDVNIEASSIDYTAYGIYSSDSSENIYDNVDVKINAKCSSSVYGIYDSGPKAIITNSYVDVDVEGKYYESGNYWSTVSPYGVYANGLEMTDTDVYVKAKFGYAIGVYGSSSSSQVTINGGSIEVVHEDDESCRTYAIGVRTYSSDIRLNDVNITSSKTGISLDDSSGNLYIVDGSVIADDTGISNSGNVYLGETGNGVSVSPLIVGKEYGINGGSLVFYDGTIKSINTTIGAEISEIETGKDIVQSTEIISGEEYKVSTLG